MIPGEYRLKSEGPVIANDEPARNRTGGRNTGDRPIQVGSHFHFFEANRELRFDRAQAFGMRLNIPAGTAVRFEAGDAKRVELTEIAGSPNRSWPQRTHERPCERRGQASAGSSAPRAAFR
jgi:urease subunit beta